MKSWEWAVVLSAGAMFAGPLASATPQYFPGTGHYYDVITDMSLPDWSAARALAEQQSWEGRNGYLACITSAEENQFVFQLTLGTSIWHTGTVWEVGPWLGGYQASGAGEPGEGWSWVSGEPWSYSAWQVGQPDDNGWMGRNEMALCYWAFAGSPAPTWNDYTDSPPPSEGRVYGYVVEFGVDATSTPRTSWAGIKAMFR
jgi:hypothetical protein